MVNTPCRIVAQRYESRLFIIGPRKSPQYCDLGIWILPCPVRQGDNLRIAYQGDNDCFDLGDILTLRRHPPTIETRCVMPDIWFDEIRCLARFMSRPEHQEHYELHINKQLRCKLDPYRPTKMPLLLSSASS